MRWRRWAQQADTYVLRHKLSRVRSALPLARYAPDHIANIVRHQNGAVRTECYSYRSSIGHPLVGSEEPGQNIPWLPRRTPVRERHEDDLVATQHAAVPGAVLPDGHAVRKAWKRTGRQPAQTQRRGVPTQRVVRRDGLCDRGRILRYPIVHRLPPVAIGPAVETPVADRGQIVGGCLVAQAVALVDHRPEHAGPWLPCHAHRVAQAAGEDAAAAISQIKLIDGSPAFLGGHAVLGDIAGRTDSDKEFP